MGKKTKKECRTKSTCTVECFSHIPPTYDTRIGGLAHRTHEDTVRHGMGLIRRDTRKIAGIRQLRKKKKKKKDRLLGGAIFNSGAVEGGEKKKEYLAPSPCHLQSRSSSYSHPLSSSPSSFSFLFFSLLLLPPPFSFSFFLSSSPSSSFLL